ncbi:MAG: GNAT family N-acetyltransferase [Pseudomonadota bacterium]
MSETTRFVVRDMIAEDRPSVMAMIDALALVERSIERDRLTDAGLSTSYLARMEHRVARSGGALLVVLPSERLSQIVGYAIVEHADDFEFVAASYRQHAYIADMYITEQWRGTGCARALVEEIVQRARASGINRVAISALARNDAANEAYKRLGFRAYAVQYVQDLDGSCPDDGPLDRETV